MEKALTSGPTTQLMKENGKLARQMAEAPTCGLTIGATMDNGPKISLMDRVPTFGPTAADIKVLTRWTKSMDSVLTNGLMVSSTKASG